jgi:hypothetical protein
MPAKRKGDEVRIPTSIRIQPKDKKLIIEHFGSLQVWIDQCLEILIKTKEVKNEN